MNRRAVSLLLMLAVALSALSGCASAPAEATPVPSVSWNGSALSGTRFVERVMPLLTVHYAEPTLPTEAERLGVMVGQFLEKHQTWGRFLRGDRVDLWVVPEGYEWPQEIPPLDRRERLARAIRPRVVVVADSLIPRDLQDKYSLENSGLLAAVATAVTQGETSPAYTVGWLHDGLGGAFSQEMRHFPAGLFTRDFNGTFSARSSPRPPAEILDVLEGTRPPVRGQISPLDASIGLAGLVMDRWGVDWPEHYPRAPEQLTPEAALLWATDAPDRETAISRGTGRMVQIIRFFQKYGPELNYRAGASFADNGRNRLTPKLERPPSIAANESPHTYRIAVDWDPATRTLAGEERLAWTNGEGVPVNHLYFNVWGNATPAIRYGGFTKVDSVSVDGRPVDFTFRGMDLEVPLGRNVGPGQSVEVSMRFATRLAAPIPPPPHVGVYNPQVRGTNAKTEDVWPLSLWYPALAILDQEGWHLDSFPKAGSIIADRADYEVRITTPPGSQVAWPYIYTIVTTEGDRTVYQAALKNQGEWTGRILVEK